ncbi:DUF6460 domain-containing protein [Pseudomonas sp. R2.Fl]|nr:DUF6460 domain-containing protein [Pseudomonas sp. R2.Fl]
MSRSAAVLFKILLASLLAGIALTFLDVTIEKLLGLVGLTPEIVLDFGRRLVAWAGPTMLLGAVVILPVWLLTHLLLPPRDY